MLRAWRDSDRDPFAAMNADDEVMRWFPAAARLRESSDLLVDRFAAEHARVGYTPWVVEVLESHRGPTAFAGYVGLVTPRFAAPFAHTDPLVEIGWRLAREWWGLGIATEASRAALRFAFDVVGLEEVVSFTVPPNLRSQAVMQRLGMRYDGVFDHPNAAPEDWWRPHVLYRVTAHDVAGEYVDAPGGVRDPSGRTPV
jgi:RimJ/RimL family protein N-acetyltransferase